MFQKLKFFVAAILILGACSISSKAFSGFQLNLCPSGNCVKETCDGDNGGGAGKIIVNNVISTSTICYTGGLCGLDAAVALANTCTSPVTVEFDSSISSKTIDLNSANFSAPLEITGSNITLDNSDNSITFQAKAGQAVFLMKGQNNLVKDIYVKGATVAPIHIDATAINADIRNVRTDSFTPGIPILQSEATDSSDANVPVMVAKSGVANQYVLYAILPMETAADTTNLRFCRTTSATSNDCLDYEKTLTSGPYTTVSTYRMADAAGNSTSDSKTLLEIAFDTSVIDVSQNYMVMVKTPNHSVAIAQLKAGLSPIFGASADIDNDSLRDIDETTYFGTDPNLNDTNGDGISDFYNMIGIPGTSTVQTTGASVYPAANTDGFLPGNYTVAAPASTTSDTSTSASGCSMIMGGDASSASSLLAMTWGFFGLAALRFKRRAISKK